jgi:hypothetical protein
MKAGFSKAVSPALVEPKQADFDPNHWHGVKALEANYPDALKLEGFEFNGIKVVKRLDDLLGANGVLYDRWQCECHCGNEIITSGTNIRRPNPQKSCGCLAMRNSRYYKEPGSVPIQSKD